MMQRRTLIRQRQLLAALGLLFLLIWLAGCRDIGRPPVVATPTTAALAPTVVVLNDEPTAVSLPATSTPVPAAGSWPCPEMARPLLVTHTGTPNALALIDPAGNRQCPVPLQPGPSASLGSVMAANGSLYYAVYDSTGQSAALWRLDANGTDEPLLFTSITSEFYYLTNFLVSADGQKIAWSHTLPSAPDGEQQFHVSLWVADSDGANQVTLLDDIALPDPRVAQPIRFTPGNNNLYYALQPFGLGGIWTSFNGRYDNIRIVPTSGGEAQLVFDCAVVQTLLCIGDIAPDGVTLAYTDANAGLVSLMRADGSLINSFTPPATDFFGYPTFAPNGDMAFVSATLAGGAELPQAQPGFISLLTVPYQVGQLQTLVSANGIAGIGQWLDAERLVVLTMDAAGNSGTALVTRSGEIQPLTSHPFSFAAVLP